MKILKTLFITLSLTSLISCSSNPTVIKTYTDKNQGRNEIAIVSSPSKTYGKKTYGAFFRQYAKYEAGKKLEYKDTGSYFFGGFADILHMLPGQYLITVHCAVNAGYKRNSFAILDVTIEVTAGGSYDVLCEPVPGDTDKVRVTTSKT